MAALRSGVTPHVLRAWERRHQVVAPVRSQGGQRLYSDLDVERLRLLHQLTERGHSIGQLARLPLEELQRIAREEAARGPAPATQPLPDVKAEEFRTAALHAARRLDAPELQAVLERAAVTLGVPGFLDSVASPAIRGIGERWSQGTISVSHEHLATAVFRQVLGWIIRMYEVKGAGPRVVVATPPRQVHELGALLAAATAAAGGWDVTYLGADLPVADILSAAREVGAHAVALSLVYPAEDAGLLADLEQLRNGLDRRAALLVGGTAAAADRDQLTSMGAEVMDSLAEFRTALQRTQEQR
jgi:DNA-binding transcriptional MerR regulator/methylmalonyl-CoA mutase cobalamin-binding subunit